MLAQTPVLAANTGGPVETIVDGETGWLRAPDDVPAWTAVVERALRLPDSDIRDMGRRGADRVRGMFGRDHMAARFEAIVDDIITRKLSPPIFNALLNFVGIGLVFALGLWAADMYTRAHHSKS